MDAGTHSAANLYVLYLEYLQRYLAGFLSLASCLASFNDNHSSTKSLRDLRA
jgi:hypothetical protein